MTYMRARSILKISKKMNEEVYLHYVNLSGAERVQALFGIFGMKLVEVSGNIER